MDHQAAFEEYRAGALAALAAATSVEDVEAARIQFLGQKKGALRELQKLVGKAAPEDRPVVGKLFNEVKTVVSEALAARLGELETSTAAAPEFDVTLPGERPRIGQRHPVTQTLDEFRQIMGRFGFTVVEGPEIEDEWHNFVALNIPEEHPARDPLDNFYLATAAIGAEANRTDGGNAENGPVLLRSQTSTLQIRVMEQQPPPLRIVSLGRVYRPDEIDRTHHFMFHQMEGLMVGPDVTMAQLKTILTMFARSYLGDDVPVRFRPSFFPFTEPSVEVDLNWNGSWMEIGGAGMVDPNVLRAVGYDPEEVNGFAFGLGIERFAMKRHNVTDIRRFHENDLRFLRQF